MAILVMCANPACGELFDAPDEAAGPPARKVRCPACGLVQPAVASGDAPAVTPVAATQTAPPPAPSAPISLVPSPAEERKQATPPPAPANEEVLEIKPRDARVLDKSLDELRQIARDSRKPSGRPAPAGPAKSEDEDIDLVPDDERTPLRASREASKVADEEDGEPVVAEPAGYEPAVKEYATAADDAGRPADSEIRFSETLDDLGLLDQTRSTAAPAPPTATDKALETRLGGAIIFVLGSLGIAGGLAAGLVLYPGQPLLAAYIGGAVGWVAGFTLAFLLVLSAERGEGKVQCPVCRNVYPADTEVCRWCGAELAAPAISPLASDCLRAGSYATSNLIGVFWLVAMLVIAQLAAAGVRLAIDTPSLVPPSETAVQAALIAAAAVIAFLVYCFWMRYLLNASSETLARSTRAPDAGGVWQFKSIVLGVKGLIVLVMYVVPLFTLPLLPLGMLFLSSPGKVRPMRLGAVVRTAWQRARDFTIMWLILLVWLAGAALAVAAFVVLYRLTDLIPPIEGAAGTTLSMIVSAAATAVAGAIAGVFGLAVFRCIGLFGRHNAEELFGPSSDDTSKGESK
ncbi:MAG: hypothetical protein ACE15C_08085 [Phycisphaerae bacterium]